MPLLLLSEQQAIKVISPNWANAAKVTGGVKNYDQLASEVETSELVKLLGIGMLQAIQGEPESESFAPLLEGGEFTNCNGLVIKFKGLKFIIAYLNWSKYVAESFVSDTYGGMVSKKTDESQPLSSGDIKRLQSNAREIAMIEWDLLREYLNINKENYPMWLPNATKKVYQPKIYGIKRTQN